MSLGNNREVIKTTYVWDIQNFAAIVMLSDTGYCLRTPVFNVQSINRQWQFHLYPNGRSEKDYIAFYLSKMNSSNQGVYNFRLSIGRPNGTPVISYEYRGESFEDRVVGKEYFLSKESNRWLLRGPVRFRCDIIEVGLKNLKLTGTSCISSVALNIADTANLSLDLENLFEKPYRSDLTVNINGNEIYIHKYMLYARCKNISHGFGYRNVMEMPSIVETEINDEIFENLMYYVYTGKLRSYVPLELFSYAKRLGMRSLLKCVHEQAESIYYNSEVEIEKKVISWNLEELKFLEKGSTCVHILRTTLNAKHLAIQLNISEGCENEKFINVSFKFFGLEGSPVALISKISLTSEDGIDNFKEEQHIFVKNEQWNFPRLFCRGHTKYSSKLDACLIAELSMFDFSSLRQMKDIRTNTTLQTKLQAVTNNLDNLGSCMGFLYQMAPRTGNLDLISEDGECFRVHDGIVRVRWPGLEKMLDEDSDTSDREANDMVNRLELSLPSNVLKLLLSYLYSGFLGYLDRENAEMLLKYSKELEFPSPLVKKCVAILSNQEKSALKSF